MRQAQIRAHGRAQIALRSCCLGGPGRTVARARRGREPRAARPRRRRLAAAPYLVISSTIPPRVWRWLYPSCTYRRQLDATRACLGRTRQGASWCLQLQLISDFCRNIGSGTTSNVSGALKPSVENSGATRALRARRNRGGSPPDQTRFEGAPGGAGRTEV